MDLLYTIDSGNTNSKMALFKDGILQGFEDFENRDPKIPGVLSTVSDQFKNVPKGFIDIDALRENKKFLGMPIHYGPTLGIDRICVAWYTYRNLIEDEVAICIDAGTFTTIDIVSKDGFLGGHIYPGVDAYFKCYEKGVKLPCLNPIDLEVKTKLGSDTITSIQNSYFLTQLTVLDHHIKQYQANKIVLTGGHAPLFFNLVERFDNLIVEYKKDLIHYSLKDIYREMQKTKLC